MKLLAQVVVVEPLALIVSLPNQLLAHVPITNISSELTARLEAMDEDMDKPENSDDEEEASQVPELPELFHPGQFVRAIVSTVHAPGAGEALGLGRGRDELHKGSRRVELSLIPEKVNEGVVKQDLKTGVSATEMVEQRRMETRGLLNAPSARWKA